MQQAHPDAWWRNHFPAGRQSVAITDINGETVSIAYGEKGRGPTLVLLHGWGNWSYSWRALIDTLAAQYHVICCDAKGQGFSDKPSRPQPIGHQIHDTAQVIQALADQPITLIGESLGGVVALAVAARYPHLIKQLIVISPAIYPRILPNRGMRLLTYLPLSLVKQFDRWRIIKPFAGVFRAIVRKQQREVVHQRPPLSKTELYLITYPYVHLRGAIYATVADSQLAARELLKSGSDSLLHRIQAELPSIQTRTLIIWGAQDNWFPVEHAQRLHTVLPNSTLHVLPNCGHSVSTDCPEALNTAIIGFLEQQMQEDAS